MTSVSRSPTSSPGDTISLELYRGSERRTAQVTLGERPDKVSEPLGAAGRAGARAARARAAVPRLARGRAHVQAGAGGDVTFAIDEEAEAWLERFLAERAPDVAFYSEDRGLVRPPASRTEPGHRCSCRSDRRDAAGDGGLRGCCVSVAAAPLGDGNPTMGDVDGRPAWPRSRADGMFVAERGRVRAATAARTAISARTPTSRACSGRSASAAGRRCR